MKKQRGDIEVIAAVVIVALCFIVPLILANWGCKSKAEVMGFRVTWGPMQGCMIEYKPGKWIGIERYRAVD